MQPHPDAREEGGVVLGAKGRLKEGTHEDPWREEEAVETTRQPRLPRNIWRRRLPPDFVLPAPAT